jgi:hypothetical protein
VIKNFSVRLKSNRRYECIPIRTNVFERGKTLPRLSYVNLSASTPCRLRLCTALGGSASKVFRLQSVCLSFLLLLFVCLFEISINGTHVTWDEALLLVAFDGLLQRCSPQPAFVVSR